jgi:peptidylprolyl isomerase
MKNNYWLIIIALILPALVLLAGCGGNTDVAKVGDTVKVHYTGTLSDNTQFDSSVGREPLQFTIGSGQVIKGFDDGVNGMKVGEKKKITIPAAQAYGEYRADLVFDISPEQLAEGVTPSIGQKLVMTQQDGTRVQVTIKAIKGNAITLDANHELAGKDLTFELELVEIVKK